MARGEPTGWVGWVYFAATMLAIVGGLQVIAGLTGIFNADFYVVAQGGHLIALDYNTWGWMQLALGVVAIAAAIGLTMGRMWAQIVCIVVAIFIGIVNLAFIGAYPWWTIASLVVTGLVIYAITLHGDEVR
jgi:hypothetical protein